MPTRWKSWVGWSLVLIIGGGFGSWLAVSSRAQVGGAGLLPSAAATLAIQATPEVAFSVEVTSTHGGAPRTFDGAVSMKLEVGEYLVDVIPESRAFQRKRLRVHLSAAQVLALPVVLAPTEEPVPPAPSPAPVEPAAPVPDDPPAPAPRMSRGLERLLFASPEGIPGEKVDARLHGRLSDPIPSVDDPNVDRDSLTRYLRSRKAAILGCYEKEVRKHGARNGRLVLHFNMTRLGRAADIAIEEDTTHNQDIGACVKAIARGWVFPFKPEGNVPVTVPFLFTRAL